MLRKEFLMRRNQIQIANKALPSRRIHSIYFSIEQNKHRNRKDIAREYLSILIMLYGSQFDNSTKQIQQYEHMTMFDANSEIKLRTIMLRAQANRIRKQKTDEQKSKENELLRKLKATQDAKQKFAV